MKQALLGLALLGAAVLQGCELPGAASRAPDAPKAITCGAGTRDTGLRCEPASCR